MESNRPVEKTTRAKSTAVLFLSTTPVIGLRQLHNQRNRYQHKAVWLAVCLAALAGLTWQVNGQIHQFLYGDPVTVVTIESGKSAHLPELEVCLPTRFSRKRADTLGVPQDVLDDLHYAYVSGYLVGVVDIDIQQLYGLGYGGIPSLGGHTMQYIHVEKMIARSANLPAFLKQAGISDVEQLLDALQHNCTDIVRKCFINGRDLHADECCTYASLRTDAHGRCTVFRKITQRLGGLGEGFFINFDLPIDDYVYDDVQAPYDGIQARLVSFDTELTPIFVKRGGRTNVAVTVSHGEYISTPNNPCQHYPIQQFDSPTTCKVACLSEVLLKCPCQSYDSNRLLSNKTVCAPSQMVMCAYQAATTITKAAGTSNHSQQLIGIRKYLSECSDRCPPSCSVTTYRTTPNFVEFSRPTENGTAGYFDSSGSIDDETKSGNVKHADRGIVGRNYTTLNVYADSLHMTRFTQYPAMTIADLVANIGGLLGFWIGGSVLAVMHLLFFWTL